MAASGGLVAAGATSGTATAQREDLSFLGRRDAYEVWALDQGTNTAHILGEFNGRRFRNRDMIEDLPDVPHMIVFSSDGEYAFIASTAGSAVSVVRADDREVVATIEEGGDVDQDVGTAHFAGITPDDSTIHIDDMANDQIHVVNADLENEAFSVETSIEVADLLDGTEGYPSYTPVCHDYTTDGQYAYVTLGPGFDGAGLFVLDVNDNEVEATFDPDRIRTNCGTITHPELDRIFLNGGGGLFDDSVWYTFSTEEHEPLARRGEERYSSGAGAHGIWLTPDGSELWQVNRVSNDGEVIDPYRDHVLAEIPEIGPAPMLDDAPYDPPYESRDDAPDNPGDKADILAASPDGEYMFATLRGLNPKSAGGVSVGENPGVAVLSVEDRERIDNAPGLNDGVWQPDDVDPLESDFHGIGVREL